MKPLLFLALLCAPAWTARAQPAAVGEIARIAETPRKPISTTTRALLWRQPGQPLHTRTALVADDRIELKSDVWIDLHLQQPGLESRVVLAPLEGRGVYRIEPMRVAQIAGLRLVVERGAMLVEHVQGELEALAADVSMLIHGTTVLIRVDSAGAFCFLQRGHVSFPGYEINVTGENQAWRLVSGQRPQLLPYDAVAAQGWRDEIAGLSRAPRPRPFWQSPYLLGAAAAVAAGGAYLLLRGSDGGDAVGTVTIPIPD